MQRLSLWRRDVVAIAVAIGLVVTVTAPAADGPGCLNCHKDQVQLWMPSVHAQAGLTCVSCHGGNPTATDETAHSADNFKRPDNKKAIAELCASCHSDVRRMNAYGLPTDQLAR